MKSKGEKSNVASKKIREDKSPQKRVELHLHTNMSEMDALPSAEEVVELAHMWGHPAVAITDHGCLQSFPAAMRAADRLRDPDFKVIYGVEAYVTDDMRKNAVNAEGVSFDDEYVAFDVETTGASPPYDKIIEIGAVKVRRGEIVSRFYTYVDPGIHIPEIITELTGISDETVKGAPGIAEALNSFLGFCDGRMLVAHFAFSNVGCIRAFAQELGIPFLNPYLDTLAVSRYLVPELKNRSLNTLADHYGIDKTEGERASDCAEKVSLIFSKMIVELKERGFRKISDLNSIISDKMYSSFFRDYHQIILVKNQTGLKNLYKLVSDSYLNHYKDVPRIPKSELLKTREGLIFGSACDCGELFRAVLECRSEDEINEIARFNDYIEIQPICNYEPLIRFGTVPDEEAIRNLNRKLINIADRLGIPVVATGNVHYIEPEDDISRCVLLSGGRYSDDDYGSSLYFRTTDEMLEEFSYLGEQRAREIVIDNPQKIASLVEHVDPIPRGRYHPVFEVSKEVFPIICHERAHGLYGNPLPAQVEERLKKEFDQIAQHGDDFFTIYDIARLLVLNSREKGFHVGCRGAGGSSFVAYLAGITRYNPLPPHYRCKRCKHSDFSNPDGVKAGYDLPPSPCPICGAGMIGDGVDIPSETFLGYCGDKVPDFDLEIAAEDKENSFKYAKKLFGDGHLFYAGSVGSLSEKIARQYTIKFFQDRDVPVDEQETERIVALCTGVNRYTSHHPCGLIAVPVEFDANDFFPVQRDSVSDDICTHFDYHDLYDTFFCFELIGNYCLSMFRHLEKFTGINVSDVPLNDPEVYKLFTSTEPLGVTPEEIGSDTGTLGLPEMEPGPNNAVDILIKTKPSCFSDLLKVSGLTHGTNAWIGNADELIENGTCSLNDVIGCRDDVMLTLERKYSVDHKNAFGIMENVRKGRGISPEYESLMKDHVVPDWYIESCKKIRYLFPKAHAVEYVAFALILGWFKLYHPVEFYAAFFSVNSWLYIVNVLKEDTETIESELAWAAENKVSEKLYVLRIIRECIKRGINFLPPDKDKSDAELFIPENGAIRITKRYMERN